MIISNAALKLEEKNMRKDLSYRESIENILLFINF
jgi:hypothetical protein